MWTKNRIFVAKKNPHEETQNTINHCINIIFIHHINH